MAVTQISNENILLPEEFIGLSTDTKPLSDRAKAGATFWELDTKAGYIFDGKATWYPI